MVGTVLVVASLSSFVAQHSQWALLLLFVLLALESFGLPLPGETTLIACAVLASQGALSIGWVIAVAIAAAIIGDNLGYWVAREGGRSLLERFGFTRRYAERYLPHAERFFARHGGKTVFLGRFVAVLRVTAAWIAGLSRMNWWRFLFWNAAGGIVWATTVGLISYYLGEAAARAIEKYGLYAGGGVVLLAVVGFVIAQRIERRVVESDEPSAAVRAQEEFRIEHAGVSLAATYSPGDRVALVALHGASAGTRDSPVYRHLHELLPPAGIGVLTFDRRGEGESTGDPSLGRFELQVEDALAVVDAVGEGEVGLWGFSQGGWIGPLAAAASDRIAFLVLVASTGVTPAQQMMYAVERQLRLSGYGDDVIGRALDLRLRFEDWVHADAPEPDEQLAAELRTAADEPWATQAWLPAALPDEEGRRRWVEEMDFDPRPVFARVQVPTLLFYGEADSWTPVAPSVAAWRAARGDDVDIVVVPGAEHDLTLPDGSLAGEYRQTLVEWLVQRRSELV
jgi:membrane protein DedA with SNARE-associated domain/pimeloyl-ACP methyl ester carboxylesterase